MTKVPNRKGTLRMSYNVAPISPSPEPWASSGASTSMPPNQKMSNLFDRLDTSGQGSISQSQLQGAFSTQNPPKAFQALGPDALFKQLDPSGTGSVTKSQFVSKMTSLMSHLRSSDYLSGQASSISSSSDTLSQSLQLLQGSGSTFSIAA